MAKNQNVFVPLRDFPKPSISQLLFARGTYPLLDVDVKVRVRSVHQREGVPTPSRQRRGRWCKAITVPPL